MADLGRLMASGDVQFNGQTFEFTRESYVNYHNQSTTFGELPQMLALSNLNQSPVRIYMPNENGVGYRAYMLNAQFSGQMREFVLIDQHYRPLVKVTNSGKLIEQY